MTADQDIAGARSITRLIERSWWSWMGPQGGYVASCLLRAATPMTPEGHRPRTLSVSFLAPLSEGEVDIRTRPLRVGGSSSVVAGEIGDPDSPSLVGFVTSAVERPGATSLVVPAPDAPDPDEVPTVEPPVEMAPFVQHVEFRPVGALPLTGGDAAELGGWMRLRDGQPVDAAAATILVDALPPALYATVSVPIAIPTVDMQVVYSGEQPEGGWVFGRIRTRNAWDGWCVEDSDIWSGDGRLLAQARQTRRVLDELP